jgi:hypothetical protein
MPRTIFLAGLARPALLQAEVNYERRTSGAAIITIMVSALA